MLRPLRSPWFLPFALLALACAAAALTVSTERWMALFVHPAAAGAEPVERALREQGALLWRVMLLASSIALLIVPLLLLPRGRQEGERHLAAQRLRTRGRLGFLLFVLLPLAAAVLLRAPRLLESLWYDEIVAWRDYGAAGPGAITGSYYDPANHIGHTLATWASVTVLGPLLGAELSLRLPALLASLLTIPAVVALMRRVRSPGVDPAPGTPCFPAALLAAIMPVAVLEGAEARGYSMMIFFAAASSAALLAARERGRTALWLLYALLAALGVWAHPMTAFVPAGHALWLLWLLRRPDQRCGALHGMAALVLAGVLATTLYAPIIPQMVALRDMLEATSADQPRLLGAEGFHLLLQLGGAWSWWAALPGLVLAAVGLVVSARHPARRDVLLAAGLGLPLMLLAVTLAGSWVYARFALFALPAAMVAIALGLHAAWRWQRAFGAFCAAALLAGYVLDLATRPPKQPLREAAMFVEARAAAGDRVVAVGLRHQVLDVYRGDLDLTYSLRHGADLPQVLERVRPRWLIVYYPRHVSERTWQIMNEAGFEPAAQLDGWVDWGNGDVVVLRTPES